MGFSIPKIKLIAKGLCESVKIGQLTRIPRVPIPVLKTTLAKTSENSGKVGKFQQFLKMSDLPDSGAGAAEEDDAKVAEKIDPKKVLHHLRCTKCQAFFRGVVYKCGEGHSTCSLCCNTFGFWHAELR